MTTKDIATVLAVAFEEVQTYDTASKTCGGFTTIQGDTNMLLKTEQGRGYWFHCRPGCDTWSISYI